MKPHQLIETARLAGGKVDINIAHRAVDMAEQQARPQLAVLADTDQAVAVLVAGQAILVRDESNCIVLVTPGQRITVTHVAAWREALALAKTFQQIYADDAERARGRALAELYHVARGQLHRQSPAWRAMGDAERGDVVARLIAAWQAADSQLPFSEFAGHWATGFEKVIGDAR